MCVCVPAMRLQVVQLKEGIAAISLEASQEAALESLLSQVMERWRGIDLDVQPLCNSRDVYVVGDTDAVQQVQLALKGKHRCVTHCLRAQSTVCMHRTPAGARGWSSNARHCAGLPLRCNCRHQVRGYIRHSSASVCLQIISIPATEFGCFFALLAPPAPIHNSAQRA